MPPAKSHRARLNAICPYFTMFPLGFPLGVLQSGAQNGESVLDPFCGRGTTAFAARLLGLSSLSVDSSPVAIAITSSKLVSPNVNAILDEAREILHGGLPLNVPESEFWRWAFHPRVLRGLCQLREALLGDCSSEPRIALRGILLGALHGPRQKTFPGYFSNQCPRTYAPKPAYALRFWQNRNMAPEAVEILEVVERRAKRFYSHVLDTRGSVRLADSRHQAALRPNGDSPRFNWVITSPPYYGMRTYIPDQWLRFWFVGGPEVVDYDSSSQLMHHGPEAFSADLRAVWRNTAQVTDDRATMVIRFGGITDRQIDPVSLAIHSLEGSGWKVTGIATAGSATEGKRQADTFLRRKSRPLTEYDIWANKQ